MNNDVARCQQRAYLVEFYQNRYVFIKNNRPLSTINTVVGVKIHIHIHRHVHSHNQMHRTQNVDKLLPRNKYLRFQATSYTAVLNIFITQQCKLYIEEYSLFTFS